MRLRRCRKHPDSVPVNALVPVKGTVLGDKLLTTGNAGDDKDAALFARLGIVAMHADVKAELVAAE